jgi:peptidoglycan hydrolase-like protein with peptidoglycan-binding domain
VKPKPAYPNVLIKEGSKGEYVKMVQRVVGVTPDGDFGAKTKAAVKTWQSKHGLSSDGIVGKIRGARCSNQN